jgi:septal ring factor EnvC (AmiA/AmiB activator)
MKKFLISALLLFVSISFLEGQSRKDLEEERKKTLEEISYMDNLLAMSAKEKKESLNELKIIGRKLNLRESVLKSMADEILLLSGRIDLNNIAIEMMEADLKVIKRDYQNAVLSSFRTSKGNSEIAYILSAKDFNQGYKRVKYLQQITKIRRQETELIQELKGEIEISKKKMEEDLENISVLRSKEEQQRNLLKSEQGNQQKIVRNLSNKERQLQRDLEEKKRIARKIENEISKLIAEERKKTATAELTPEQKLISDNFYENKGRLPWPVEKGVITSHFGIHNHPVLKYVVENNNDIEITNSGETQVRSVFKGTVARVFSIQGANTSIIVKHGRYYTVYSNLINVAVKAGDKVDTKQILGYVYNDLERGNEAVLKFMITEEKVNLDPELWISKKN